ncbi:modification methylase HaeIII domain protein, partial [Acinetobacter sp. 1396970]
KRVIFIGFRSDLNVDYSFPEPTQEPKHLEDIIKDLEHNAVPALNKSKPNPDVEIANHEYMTGGFSSMYMSRNRVRAWDEHLLLFKLVDDMPLFIQAHRK